MTFCRLLLAALLVAAFPAAAQTPVSTSAKPRVVATFSILGNLVAEVAGDRVDLAVLVGPDTDAHTYQPKPTDARTVAEAQALVSNGLGFEGWMDRLAKAASFTGRAIVATSGVPTLEAAADGGHRHAHDIDPHCWQDVGRVRRYVGNIAEGLSAADANNAATYRARARAYDRRLDAGKSFVPPVVGPGYPAQAQRGDIAAELATAHRTAREAWSGCGTGAPKYASVPRATRTGHRSPPCQSL